ncbi:MAG: hypothetical protein GQ574_29445 [Crocinitomix sp.]|nr:hypothetical protein [Crocinitomix sp.]
MIANDEDPGRFYEVEEYEALFSKIVSHKKYIPIKEMKDLEGRLKEQIIFQKGWEDEYYD